MLGFEKSQINKNKKKNDEAKHHNIIKMSVGSGGKWVG